MSSFLTSIASQSEPAADRFASIAAPKLDALRAKEEEAAAFSEAEILHKSNVAMDAKVRSNTKYLLNDVGLRLSAQV